MPKQYDHFESYEWLGLFWTPNKEMEFPGKLIYKPEDGITLEFLCAIGPAFDKTAYIHGILSTGEACTLLGDFDSEKFGFFIGENSFYKGKPRFYAAIFGRHTTPEALFPGFALDLTNFQEFCHPQGWKDFAKYSSEPLYKTKIGNLELSIINTGEFRSLKSNLENIIHCENPEVVEEISKSILEISKKYDDAEILHRQDIGWEIWAENANGMTYAEINKNILQIEYLLSLLIFSPVRRAEVWLLNNSQDVPSKFYRIPVLCSFFDMSRYKIEVLHREISNLHLAITPRTLDNFSVILLKWFEGSDAYQTFGSRISNRFGKYHDHDLRASIIMYLVQLESIAISLGNHKQKYNFPIQKYDLTNISDSLGSILGLEDKSKIGEQLGRLRGEIAHLASKNKILNKIGVGGLMRLNRCLEVIIASYIYEQLGVPANNIAEFQKNAVLG